MAITDFHGNYFFLSNFFEAPFFYRGYKWNTVEHAFQAMKSIKKEDIEMVHAAVTPGEAKRLGRKVHLVPDWDIVRNEVMRDCLRMKFLQNDTLFKQLLDTGNEVLVEGNTWHDNYWGNCTCDKCHAKEGVNMLGQLLMELRKNIRENNFVWVARDVKAGLKIVEHFKNRENALSWMSNQHGYNADSPYEANGYRLDVVQLK